ncbi:hypothetical protein CK203_084434 [Vitis vinifera]|uniref:Protein kinase domain-containing protein n=1 Tax=Vitis vinifera TaxID=29760 RepID=A0A438EN91_VITVI|nr:hypothetical protein CK203_084434 [Vitis vinifera]
MEKKKYPIGPEFYTLYEEIGQGVSASVLRALCVPLNEIVAIKILDFERDNCDLHYNSTMPRLSLNKPNLFRRMNLTVLIVMSNDYLADEVAWCGCSCNLVMTLFCVAVVAFSV